MLGQIEVITVKTKNGKNFQVVKVLGTVDWLTGTSNREVSRNRLSTACHLWMNDGLARGEKVHVWESYGYKGWQCGGLRWGRREQDDLIQLHSDEARESWQKVLPLLTNVTRVDLAVTVWMDRHYIQYAREVYQEIEKLAEDLPIIRNYAIITSLLGGDTLYVGKRQSSQMGRIYDKTMESKQEEYANSWRYEVEYKKPIAQQVVERLAHADDAGAYIQAQVHQWFSDRLIFPVYLPQETQTAIAIKRRKTADEKALEWLATQVRPTVERLTTRGLKQKVIEILQLSE